MAGLLVMEVMESRWIETEVGLQEVEPNQMGGGQMKWKQWIDGGVAEWNGVNGLLSPDRVEGSGVASGRRLSHAAARWGCEWVIAGGARLPGRTRGPSRQACEKTVTASSSSLSGMVEWWQFLKVVVV